jgi:glutamate--cysteine ligase
MSIPQSAGAQPIESRDALVGYFESGCKRREDWRIGTEHEKFCFYEDSFEPVSYEGPRSIKALLEGLVQFGWQPIHEGGHIIGLTLDSGSISLEPGGQFELSGAPLNNVHETCNEVHTHLAQLEEVAEPLNIGFIGLGFSPKWSRAQTPHMPKGRYDIMTRYMPKRGGLGLDMMYRTCTVQVNLDFSSEDDMRRKLRVALALQPIATALFANSPFAEGKPNGFLSFRAQIWRDTDPDRTGLLPFAFEEGFGFERYVDYALDVPMYFVFRESRYIDVAGQSFRDFLEGRLPALPGERPTLNDWADHLTTIFPEARLKRFLEMRGADGGPWKRLCALPALWVGLLYDEVALDEAWQLAKDWTGEERERLRKEVPVTALKTVFRGRRVQEIARDLLAIARRGLVRRRAQGKIDPDESCFLETLEQIVDSGQTPAEELLAAYKGHWNGNIDRVFEDYAY